MKILVTGATGKVGPRLAKRLATRGDHVRALVRDRARAAGRLGDRVEVYGPTDGRLARESDVGAPIAAYPASKLAAERFLLSLDGLDVRVLRLLQARVPAPRPAVRRRRSRADAARRRAPSALTPFVGPW